jgi:hypothetical protein
LRKDELINIAQYDENKVADQNRIEASDGDNADTNGEFGYVTAPGEGGFYNFSL